MEKKKYDLLMRLLERLHAVDVLDNVLVIGSWCMLFYEYYFNSDDFRAAIRTRDVDLLIPIPFKMHGKIDLHAILEDLGFVVILKGRDGYQTFQHPDLILEFLVPERGRGHEGPYIVPALGINAQPLRYLDLLTERTVLIDCGAVRVRVPHPANFAIHKLIISARRITVEKAEKDIIHAVSIIEALTKVDEGLELSRVVNSIPKTWQKLARQSLAGSVHADLVRHIFHERCEPGK